MRHLYALLLTLCFALAAPLRAQPNPFEASVETVRENRVPLRIHPANNLQTLQATLNGKPCTLLFDTGASHTTFNDAFIKAAFPDLPRQPLILPGQTNVRQRPDLIPVASLSLGNTTLRDFYAMVLPLDHLSRAVGTPIDGILGANSIAYAPCLISLRQAAVTWAPSANALPANFAAAPELPLAPECAPLAPITLLARRTPEGAPCPLLLDTGSSYTFLPTSFWPAAEETLALAATNVNASNQKRYRRGQPGSLLLGECSLPITPLLTDQNHHQIGADLLANYDLFVDFRRRLLKVLP